MLLLLRRFEIPHISWVVWLVLNGSMTKICLQVENGSINSFYGFSEGWLLATSRAPLATVWLWFEEPSLRPENRFQELLSCSLPPLRIGAQSWAGYKCPAILPTPPRRKKSQYKVGQIANQEGGSIFAIFTLFTLQKQRAICKLRPPSQVWYLTRYFANG